TLGRPTMAMIPDMGGRLGKPATAGKGNPRSTGRAVPTCREPSLAYPRCRSVNPLSLPKSIIPKPPVELYLLRHAIAVERGTAGFEDDRLRPLTEEGRAKMERIAAGMKKLGLEFDLILTSPYLRARETAELTAATIGQKGSMELEPALQADRSPPGFVAKLASKFAHHERVLAVGHEPFLSSLATLLLGLPGGSA